jgi:hypothetical protein
MGSTKEAIFFETPDFSVTDLIVKGRATIDEQVEKAVMRGGGMPR